MKCIKCVVDDCDIIVPLEVSTRFSNENFIPNGYLRVNPEYPDEKSIPFFSPEDENDPDYDTNVTPNKYNIPGYYIFIMVDDEDVDDLLNPDGKSNLIKGMKPYFNK